MCIILVTYGINKISCAIINRLHTPIQHLQNALAYFDRAICCADTMTILIMTLLIMTLLIMTLVIMTTYNDSTYNDSTYNDSTYNDYL
jgi:hypothetical protein